MVADLLGRPPRAGGPIGVHPVDVPDELGHVHRGMRVDAVNRATVAEAQKKYDCDPTVAATLWVLDQLGKL